MSTTTPTAADVAHWMDDALRSAKRLKQSTAVRHIKTHFGSQFLYKNDNRNPAIVPEVLALFNALNEKDAVWVKGKFLWRMREAGDPPGREYRRPKPAPRTPSH